MPWNHLPLILRQPLRDGLKPDAARFGHHSDYDDRQALRMERDINSFITVEIDGTKIDDIRFNVEDEAVHPSAPRDETGETAKIIYEPVYGERGLVDQKNVIEYGFTATIMR